MHPYTSVDEYITAQPKEVQPGLLQMRRAINSVVPHGKEVISYGMPAVKEKNIVVWYAATKKHFALYPKNGAIAFFKEQLSSYNVSKGTIRFPLHQPLPIDLIKAVVNYRVQENAAYAVAKEASKIKKLRPKK